MAFASGQKITASDYNNLLIQLNDVYGTGTGDKGYGATDLPPVDPFPFDPSADLVKAGTLSKDNDLTDLVTAIDLMGQHQGNVPLLPTINQPGEDIEIGDLIQAFSEIPPALTQVTTNRLNVDPSSTTLTSSILLSLRSDPWSSQIAHIFTVDFGSDDDARWFFNTGGQIRLAMSAPVSPLTASLDAHNWGKLYNDIGTFIFDATEYYGLSPTINNFTTVSIAATGGGVYSSGYPASANQWIISVKFITGTSANGARGSKLEFTSLSDDVYTGPIDIVTGGFTSTISERRSTTFFNRPAPIYETTSSLGSFSPLAIVDEYEINKSLLFDDAVAAQLTRTPASPGNLTTWTYSCWAKLNDSDNHQLFFGEGTGGTAFEELTITNSHTTPTQIGWQSISGSQNYFIASTDVFRDSTAWYHFVFTYNSGNIIASDRQRVYVNGIRITSLDPVGQEFPTLNEPSRINTNSPHSIGLNVNGLRSDMYLAESIFIDGQALGPESFGEFNINGDWIPIDPSELTFGQNGFWLDYEDVTSATALGADISGQFNHFTPNNISTTDQTLDTPTDSTGLRCSINLSTNNYNLATELGIISAENITLNIRPNVVIGSTSTGVAAFTTGSLPAGSSLIINNEGRIQGHGGDGGNGTNNIANGSPGKFGGDALNITLDTVIDNTNGEIWGGAGGGGGARSTLTTPQGGGGGGGGGAGTLSGDGGAGGIGIEANGGDGDDGTSELGGAGGASSGPTGQGASPPGGKGGDPGEQGTAASDSIGGTGGAAGKAVNQNGFTATFSFGGISPNVEGNIV